MCENALHLFGIWYIKDRTASINIKKEIFRNHVGRSELINNIQKCKRQLKFTLGAGKSSLLSSNRLNNVNAARQPSLNIIETPINKMSFGFLKVKIKSKSIQHSYFMASVVLHP